MKYIDLYNRTVDLLEDNERLKKLARDIYIVEDYRVDESKRNEQEKEKLFANIKKYQAKSSVAGKSIYIESPNQEESSLEYYSIYINPKIEDMDKFTNRILEKCEEKNLPYNINLSYVKNEHKRVKIKASLENLPNYIELLDEIGKEYPEIKEKSATPPILAGSIDNWIGYSINLDYLSRVRVVSNVLFPTIQNWLENSTDKLNTVADNPLFIEKLKENIRKEVEDENISSEKICFSKYTKPLFMDKDHKMEDSPVITDYNVPKQYKK